MPTFPGMADIFERYGVENGNARVGVGGGVHGKLRFGVSLTCGVVLLLRGVQDAQRIARTPLARRGWTC
jgi:hypothetical protein